MKSPLIRVGTAAGALAAMAAAMSGPVMAQTIGAEPSFADLRLRAGFEPDPQRIEIVAGGTIEAGSVFGDQCVGVIADEPDIRLTYRPDQAALTIKALSGGDTTLVINDPNGNWVCDDDSGGGVDPLITFSDPQEGVYEIWVGTIGEEAIPAVVEITELD